MIHEVKKTGMKCPVCGYRILINGERLFCQKCRKAFSMKDFKSMKLDEWM